ncbi:hypothetical protein [Microbispora bryophytorum]|uniref:hypothetical protein n=1 Tax=Microbispora bryophytorum TaxID=1460882 RepID=UPI0033E690C5
MSASVSCCRPVLSPAVRDTTRVRRSASPGTSWPGMTDGVRGASQGTTALALTAMTGAPRATLEVTV